MAIKSCLIADTTREERQKIVNDGLAMSTLDAGAPTTEVMELVELYIDGKLELSEIETIVLNRYRRRYVG